ncbi:MFS transporter [Rothia kristinae]|uniref:MFS transporter n=1 Tax=Rothia kristinae TaxID=37923 RepID=UPI00342F1A7E
MHESVPASGIAAQPPSRKWIIWSVGLAAYLVAVINRSSFSALGPAAQEHFSAEATALSVFVVVQLVVYAGWQIPVGILLDRFGISTVIAAGTAVMAVGQLLLGATDSIPLAILARILVGSGDACIFTAVVRLVQDWFTLGQMPVVNQLTGLSGQVGQLLAVAPLAALVAGLGWFAGFAALAAVGAAVLVLVLLVLRDAPGAGTILERITGTNRTTGRDVAAARAGQRTDSVVTDVLPVIGPESTGVLPALRSLVRRPGVRLAFWIHFSTVFAMHSFMLLWGTPFMTGGLGYPEATSHLVLSLTVAASMAGAVLLGPVISRFSAHRVWIAVGGTTAILLSWVLVLAWPGSAPVPVMSLAAVCTGLGGPLSMIAFDVVRTHAPVRQLGVATGLTNMGGFTAALTTVLLVGVLLDAQGAGTPETYSSAAFRWAMAVQVPVWLLGLTMMLIERPKARREHLKRLHRAR